MHQGHRLIWLYEYGYFPEMIDHINHTKTDNRLCNLREAVREINGKNRPLQSNNTSGVHGVSWHSRNKRWTARINVDKKRISLGRFANYSDAVNARMNAEVLYGYSELHGKDL